MKKGKLSPILLLIIVVLLAGAYYYFYSTSKPGQSSKQNSNNVYEVNVTDNNDTPAPGIKIPDVTPGYRQYKNETFRFGFNYKEADSVSECPEKTCAAIPTPTVKFQVVSSQIVPTGYTEDTLLSTDLYCNSSSPALTTTCQNTVAEQYLATTGLEGNVVLRVKTMTGDSSPRPNDPEFEDDLVYFFPFKQPINYSGQEYTGVLFYADYPLHTNLGYLNEVIETLFIY